MTDAQRKAIDRILAEDPLAEVLGFTDGKSLLVSMGDRTYHTLSPAGRLSKAASYGRGGTRNA